MDAQVGITPRGGVQAAQVIAADEGGATVHHEQLTVFQRVASRVEEMPGTDAAEQQELVSPIEIGAGPFAR